MTTDAKRPIGSLKAIASHVTWHDDVTPFLTPTEEWFSDEVKAYIATAFDHAASLEDVYLQLVDDLKEEITACPEHDQSRFRHILYLAVAAAKDTGRHSLPGLEGL